MAATHGAVGLNAEDARFFTNSTFHVTVLWGGGRAAVHIWQAQPSIDFRHEMKWVGDPYGVVPNELLGEVLRHSMAAGRNEAAEHLTSYDLRNQHEPLAWRSPTTLPGADRARYGLTEAA
ncbi:hypothetical protein [Streptomyces sp. NPDC006134]|uniref:hypothetical protein n=1 Tax=Streptomyces sp. NPDC006134 TaxID=3154467 RepID=UPI0034044DA7